MERTRMAHPVLRSFEESFARARAGGLVKGALLATRDGMPVLNLCPEIADPELYAAMHATALGASEIAMRGLGRSSRVTLVAEMRGQRFLSRSVSDELFVVALVDPRADCAAAGAWLDALSAAIAR